MMKKTYTTDIFSHQQRDNNNNNIFTFTNYVYKYV